MLEPLTSAEECVEASSGDPLVTQLVTRWVPEPGSWRLGAAVGARCSWWGYAELYVIGPPEDSAALVREAVAAGERGPRLSTSRRARALLPWPAEAVEHTWAFRSTASPPAVPTDVAAWLADPVSEVAGLLARAFADASMQADDPHVRRWAGIRAADGGLVACVADGTADDRLGFFASLTVDPATRGAGLGERLSAWVTAELLREHPRVGLWHMGENLVADRLYTRLGFRDDHQMVAFPTPGGSRIGSVRGEA